MSNSTAEYVWLTPETTTEPNFRLSGAGSEISFSEFTTLKDVWTYLSSLAKRLKGSVLLLALEGVSPVDNSALKVRTQGNNFLVQSEDQPQDEAHLTMSMNAFPQDFGLMMQAMFGDKMLHIESEAGE